MNACRLSGVGGLIFEAGSWCSGAFTAVLSCLATIDSGSGEGVSGNLASVCWLATLPGLLPNRSLLSSVDDSVRTGEYVSRDNLSWLVSFWNASDGGAASASTPITFLADVGCRV